MQVSGGGGRGSCDYFHPEGRGPVVVHVLDLPLDVAVDALAVGAVGQLAHHAQSVRPLLAGKQLLDGHHDALAAPLPGDAHHFLPQGDLGRPRSSFFGFAPASLQRSAEAPGGINTQDGSVHAFTYRLMSDCATLPLVCVAMTGEAEHEAAGVAA